MACCSLKKRTWRFDNIEQLTAANILREIVGFSGEFYMDFTKPLRNSTVINPIIAPVVSIVLPSGITVTSPIVLDDAVTVALPLVIATTGTYLFVITVVDLYGEELTRRGVAIVESLTGT